MANKDASPNVSELDVIRAYYQSVLTLDSSSPSSLTSPLSTQKPLTTQKSGGDDGTPTIKRRKGRKINALHSGLRHPPWNPVEGISKVHLIPLQSASNQATCATSSPLGKSGSVNGPGTNIKWRDTSTLPPDLPDVVTLDENMVDEMEEDELRSSPPLDPFGMISPPRIDLNAGNSNGAPVKRKKMKKIQEDNSVVERNGGDGNGQITTPKRTKKSTSAKTPTKTPTSNGALASETKEKKQRKKKDQKDGLNEAGPSTNATTTSANPTNGGEDRMEETDMDQNAIEDLVGSSPPASPVKEKKKPKAKSKSAINQEDVPATPVAPQPEVEDEGKEVKKKSKAKRKSMLSPEMTGTSATPSTPVNGNEEGKKEKKNTRKSKAAPSWVVNTPR